MGSSNKMKLKLLINKKENRVLYAEAGKDFVDFLFHIFLLPLGAVTKNIISKECMVGSLGNLYESIRKLDESYMQPNTQKSDLLNPTTHITPTLSKLSLSLLPSCPIASTQLYSCPKIMGGPRYPKLCKSSPVRRHEIVSCDHEYVSCDPEAICPSCRRKLSRKISLIRANDDAEESGYVKEVVTYIITDDLEVKPMSNISSIVFLKDLGVKDMGDLEEKVVHPTVNQGLMLLQASLESKAVLTRVFLETKLVSRKRKKNTTLKKVAMLKRNRLFNYMIIR